MSLNLKLIEIPLKFLVNSLVFIFFRILNIETIIVFVANLVCINSSFVVLYISYKHSLHHLLYKQ